jgi:hypothetical protein
MINAAKDAELAEREVEDNDNDDDKPLLAGDAADPDEERQDRRSRRDGEQYHATPKKVIPILCLFSKICQLTRNLFSQLDMVQQGDLDLAGLCATLIQICRSEAIYSEKTSQMAAIVEVNKEVVNERLRLILIRYGFDFPTFGFISCPEDFSCFDEALGRVLNAIDSPVPEGSSKKEATSNTPDAANKESRAIGPIAQAFRMMPPMVKLPPALPVETKVVKYNTQFST